MPVSIPVAFIKYCCNARHLTHADTQRCHLSGFFFSSPCIAVGIYLTAPSFYLGGCLTAPMRGVHADVSAVHATSRSLPLFLDVSTSCAKARYLVSTNQKEKKKKDPSQKRHLFHKLLHKCSDRKHFYSRRFSRSLPVSL